MRETRTYQASQTSASHVLTGSDLRRIYGISDSTLRLWRERGLPYVGGGLIRPRYRLEEVEAWLRSIGKNG
jgi:hypothetical protein